MKVERGGRTAVYPRRVAEKVVHHGLARLWIKQVGNAAAAQVHHANFGNKGGKRGSNGRIHRIAARLQNLLTGCGRRRIPRSNHTSHNFYSV